MINKILIIEDDMSMARALELKLTRAGFEVKSAVNGEDGLVLFEKEDFSLILLDLVIPKIDGFKLLEKLKENRQNNIFIKSKNGKILQIKKDTR